MEHPAVAEAGVIGKPDPVALEIVKAFVVAQGRLRADRGSCGASCSASRARDSAPRSRRRRSSSCRALPKTRSGKIMRRLLKARELGLPEGDTSTLREQSADMAASRRCRLPPRTREHALELLRQMLLHPPLRGEVPPSCTRWARSAGFLHLYIGEEAVAVGAMQALTPGRRHRLHLPRARPGAGPRHAGRRAHGRDVRQGQRLQPRPRRLDALLRRWRGASTAATPSSAAGCRSRWAWRWPTSCRAGRA